MNRESVWRAVILLVAVVVVVLVAGLLYLGSNPKGPEFIDYSKVVAASQRYRMDLESRHETVPESVTLRELLEKGFVAHDQVRNFDGLEVTISLRTDAARPQEALMRVRFPNGDECVALGDGSVQQFRH